jgi:hypothetical protein
MLLRLHSIREFLLRIKTFINEDFNERFIFLFKYEKRSELELKILIKVKIKERKSPYYSAP